MTPPELLTDSQSIARVKAAAGNNLYSVELPDSNTLLVELDPRFRSTIWLKRGGFVLVDTAKSAERKNKIDGEIVNVVRDEKAWKKTQYWPKEFIKSASSAASAGQESKVGRMPPSDNESES